MSLKCSLCRELDVHPLAIFPTPYEVVSWVGFSPKQTLRQRPRWLSWEVIPRSMVMLKESDREIGGKQIQVYGFAGYTVCTQGSS